MYAQTILTKYAEIIIFDDVKNYAFSVTVFTTHR